VSFINFEPNDFYGLKFELYRYGEGKLGEPKLKGKVAIEDTLSIDFDEPTGTYTVCNLDGPDAWIGVHTDKNIAVMRYLYARLGIQPEQTEG
jgi:hypothetical protein